MQAGYSAMSHMHCAKPGRCRRPAHCTEYKVVLSDDVETHGPCTTEGLTLPASVCVLSC